MAAQRRAKPQPRGGPPMPKVSERSRETSEYRAVLDPQQPRRVKWTMVAMSGVLSSLKIMDNFCFRVAGH